MALIKAHVHLVQYMLAKGYSITVFDGYEYPVKKSRDEKLIFEHIDSVEVCNISIYSPEQEKRIAVAIIIDQGMPEETVADYSDNEVMQEWEKEYDKLIETNVD